MSPRTLALGLLLAFASIETVLAVLFVSFYSAYALPAVSGSPDLVSELAGNPAFHYSLPLSAAAWVSVGLVYFEGRAAGRRSKVRSLFTSMGFGSDVYDLMMGMRGAGSRVSLLENMETPRHRLELSELTGIDWKEVDRQLSVLEKYGLVKVQAQSGTVKLYQVTEQGKLLLNLVEELNNKKP